MKIIDIPSSGKCGITVTMPGRYGQVRRAWVSPANPRSPMQLTVRSTLATNAAAFRSLTEAQQDAWNAAAQSQSSRSRLGQSGPLTGLQFYVRINSNLRLLGQDAVDVPPAPHMLPDLAPQSLVITNTAGVIALKLTCLGDPGEATVVRGCAPVSSAVRANPSFRTLGTCPAAVAGSADITDLYTARFGVPAAGQRVFVSAHVMDGGYNGSPRYWSALVPASA